MKKTLFTIFRLIALVILYLALFTFASQLTTPPDLVQHMTPDQVKQSTATLPVVSLIMSLMLSYLAIRSRWHGWKLVGALFVISYGLYTFLGWIELLAFPAVSRYMPNGMLSGLLMAGLILTIPFSFLAVWILGKTGKYPSENEINDRLIFSRSEWIWRLAAGAVLYEIVYFTFGYFIAWRTPGLPEFYGGTDPGTFFGQLANVMRDTPWLFVLQIFRGLIWTGIGCIIVRMHKGRAWETILATGLTFTVIMNASLLFPDPFMPALVAHAHSIELVSSNFIYGILLAMFMFWNPAKQIKSTRQAPDAN
ncbi:MAG: hypothetical protein ABSE06_01785 [Anaerolineaceae bacterium]|jgi:hypothetical protein